MGGRGRDIDVGMDWGRAERECVGFENVYMVLQKINNIT